MNVIVLLHMFRVLSQLNKHDSWNRQQLEAYQQRRLNEIRTYAYKYSSFYQRFHKGLYEKPLKGLPVLTKKTLMEEFDDVVTDRAIRLEEATRHKSEGSLYLGRYRVAATSGSSGIPGMVLFNQDEWAAVMASYARGQKLAGVTLDPFHSHKFAFILSQAPYHMTNLVGRTMYSPWARLLYMFATEPLQTLVQRLNVAQPEILGGYASIIGLLAGEQIAGHLHIRPTQVFVSGEVLTAETEHLIQHTWGNCLFNEYAATETAVIGAGCEQHNGLHVYEDLMILENVDEHNRPVPPGEYGARLLVTVLFNRTQPLIRYELTDSVRMSDALCGCGRPYTLIESVQGRQDEILRFPAPDGRLIPVHPILFMMFMSRETAGNWQIIRREDGLHVLVTHATETTQLEQGLRKALAEQGIVVPPVHIQQVEAIPRPASGKLLLVKSEMSQTQTPIPA